MPTSDPLSPSAAPGNSHQDELPGARSEPVAGAPRRGRRLWRGLVSGVAFWLGGTVFAAGAFLGVLSIVAPRPAMKMAVTLDQNAVAVPAADRAKATATSRAAGATTASPPGGDAGKHFPSRQATSAGLPSADKQTANVERRPADKQPAAAPPPPQSAERPSASADAPARVAPGQATSAGQPSADKQTAIADKRSNDKQPRAEPPPSAERPAASAEAPARPQRERSVERRQRHKDGDRRVVERDRDMRSGRSVASRRDGAEEPVDADEADDSAVGGFERRRILLIQPEERRHDFGFFDRLFAPHDAD